MSDIRLLRPVAGTNQAVTCEPEANFVFDFPTDAATLSRSGDDLVMTFEDGATLSLTDFYKTYSSENMPSFDVGGAQVAGADFFTAMNEPDLMPAAGPGGNTAPGGGRYHEYANMALYDGLDRLGGLDVGWPDGGYEPEIDGGAGDEAGHINATPSLDNFTTTPDDDGRNPDAAGTGSAGIVVDEAAFVAGTGGEAGSGDRGHGYKGTGGFDVHLNGEGGTVTLTDPGGHQVTLGVNREGNVTVQQGTGLTVNGVLVNDFSGTVDGDGSLHVEYKYALEESRTHGNANSVGADDALRGQIGIHVVDGSGDEADGSLRVEVHDDGPVLSGINVTTTKLPSNEEADGSKDAIVVDDAEEKIQVTLDGANWGADQGEGAQITVTVRGKTYTWTKDANGEWERTAGGNELEYDPAMNKFTYTRPADDVEESGENSKKDSYTFNVQITDSDGDSASQEITVKTVGTPGFTNPEDTPDSDPDPDPQNPSTHLSTARTDDSYVPEQTDDAGKVTQPVGTAENSTNVEDSATRNTAYGRFGVTLNGDEYTLEVTGEGEPADHLTLYLDENGKVTHYKLNDKEKTPWPENDGVTVQGVYGDLTITQKDGGEFSYTYTQKKSYDHSNNSEANLPDEVAKGAEHFNVTVQDQHEHTLNGHIDVNIEDDEPILGGVTIVDGKYITPTETDPQVPQTPTYEVNDANKKIEFTLQDANWGADQGEGAQITVTVRGKTYTWTKDADGEWEQAAGENELEYDPATNKFTYTRPESDVQDPEKEGSSPDSDSYTFNVQITDSDGDSASQEVTVKTVGTPGFTNPEDTPDSDPDPDPQNPSTHLSTARTDDSYVPEQMDDAGKVTQPEGTMAGKDGQLEKEVNNVDNAKSYTDDHGRFGVTLNGDEYTITITDKDGNTHTLTLDGQGNLKAIDDEPGTTLPDEGFIVEGEYGDLTITEVTAGEFKYTYTQKKSYDHRHEQGDNDNLPDEVAERAEHFNVTVQDQHEHTLNGHIDVNIEDDEPTLSGITVTTDRLTPNEEADGSKDAIVVDDANEKIEFTLDGANWGADQGDGAQVTVTVGNETYTWTKDADGGWEQTAGKNDLEYDPATNTFTYTRPADDVEESGENSKKDSYTFNVQITDSDGDSASQEVTVKTVGTPGFTNPEDTPDSDPDPDPQNPSTHLSTARTDDSYVPEQTETGEVTGNTTVTQPAGTAENSTEVSGSASRATDDHGRFGVTLNGDEYTLEVTGEDGSKLTLHLDGEGKVTSYELDGVQHKEGLGEEGVTVKGVYGDLTITEDAEKGGEFNYTYTQKKSYDHSNNSEANLPDEVAKGAEHFNVTVQDQHEHTLNGHIDVNIEDDEPIFDKFTQETGHVEEQNAQKSLDFVLEKNSEPTNSWKDFREQNESHDQHWGDDKETPEHLKDYKVYGYNENTGEGDKLHWGVNNGIKIIPTSVTYENGTVRDIGGEGWQNHNPNDNSITHRKGDLIDDENGSSEAGKTLWLTDEGLGVGSDSGHEISGHGRDAEAIVLEVNNGSVSYGLDITFGNFEEGDRVLITFYLTPRNNDDNDIVKQVEVTWDDLENWHYKCDLPDGFNKVIISPLPQKRISAA